MAIGDDEFGVAIPGDGGEVGGAVVSSTDPSEGPDLLLNYYDCDVCGFTYRKTKLFKRWDGLLVCKQDLDFKHPREVALEEGGLTNVIRHKVV